MDFGPAGEAKDQCNRQPEDADAENTTKCARPGCIFQRSWHASHCCSACVKKSGSHGPRCEKQLVSASSDASLQDSAERLEEMGFGPAGEAKDQCNRQPEDADAENTTTKCARPGCNFRRSWHASHCCSACVKKSGSHGPRCE